MFKDTSREGAKMRMKMMQMSACHSFSTSQRASQRLCLRQFSRSGLNFKPTTIARSSLKIEKKDSIVFKKVPLKCVRITYFSKRIFGEQIPSSYEIFCRPLFLPFIDIVSNGASLIKTVQLLPTIARESRKWEITENSPVIGQL